MKKAKPRKPRAARVRGDIYGYADVSTDDGRASICAEDFGPSDARRLARWLLAYADWAESREKP